MPGDPVLHRLVIALQELFFFLIKFLAYGSEFNGDVVHSRYGNSKSVKETYPVALKQTHGTRLQRAESTQVFRVANPLATQRCQIFRGQLSSTQIKRGKFLSGTPNMNVQIDHNQVVENGNVCHGIFSYGKTVLVGKIW